MRQLRHLSRRQPELAKAGAFAENSLIIIVVTIVERVIIAIIVALIRMIVAIVV